MDFFLPPENYLELPVRMQIHCLLHKEVVNLIPVFVIMKVHLRKTFVKLKGRTLCKLIYETGLQNWKK